jgi:hypothetical protein
MKSFTRNALLGAAGLVALSLPANATGSTAVTDTPLFKSNTETVKPMQLAQRPYDPSAGSVGFKKGQGASVGFNKAQGSSVGFKKTR